MDGHGIKAECLFEEMLRERDVFPNEVMFLGVLNACCHAGLIQDGVKYSSLMSKAYGIYLAKYEALWVHG